MWPDLTVGIGLIAYSTREFIFITYTVFISFLEPEVMQLLKSKRHLAELANNVDCTDSEMPLPAQPLSKSPPPPNSQGSAVPKPTPQHEVNEERQDDSGMQEVAVW